jgi:polyisoprenyl-phosphate glycosyltransferase
MNHHRTRSVIIFPVYNEEENVTYFFERLKAVFEVVDQSRYDCLLIFTNNCSTDATLQRIRELEATYDWVYHLTLSRNFGYQLSVLSGITTVDADLYMICDVDCEDPPEMFHQFLEQIEQGRDVAYGIRTNRPDPMLMLFFRKSFYRLLQRIGDFTIVPYMAEFCMFKRTVREVIIANSNNFPFIRAEIGYAGFNRVGLPYRREPRRYGKTHYNYIRNFQFAWWGILTSTTVPLRAALYGVPFIILTNLLLLLLYRFGQISFEWATLNLLSLDGIYLSTFLGFGTVYIARIYHNTLGRKRFIIDYVCSKLPK